jgi:polygalacturonase
MDPECCSDVKVIGVYFSVGDDCIALKSGKMYIGSKYQVPTEHVEIRNCYMHEGHGAIVLGSEVSAGVKDIKVERCYFEHTDRGFRIKTRRGRGKTSVIDKVLFKDIVMEHVLTPLVINMFYFCDPDGKSEYVWSKEKLPIDDRTPYLGSFTFENIQARDAEYALGWFYGLPEMPIKSVTIKNSSFTVKKDADKGMPAMMSNIQECSKKGFCFFNVQQVVLENVKAEGYEGKEVETSAVSSLQIL